MSRGLEGALLSFGFVDMSPILLAMSRRGVIMHVGAAARSLLHHVYDFAESVLIQIAMGWICWYVA